MLDAKLLSPDGSVLYARTQSEYDDMVTLYSSLGCRVAHYSAPADMVERGYILALRVYPPRLAGVVDSAKRAADILALADELERESSED